MEKFEKLRYILEVIQYETGETWRFEIYANDHMSYELFCPNPKQDKWYQVTLQGEWLDNLIELKANCGEIEETIKDIIGEKRL